VPQNNIRGNRKVTERYKQAEISDLFVAADQSLLHFAWVVDDAKSIVVTLVCMSVCLSVCPRPYAHTNARTLM